MTQFNFIPSTLDPIIPNIEIFVVKFIMTFPFKDQKEIFHCCMCNLDGSVQPNHSLLKTQSL